MDFQPFTDQLKDAESLTSKETHQLMSHSLVKFMSSFGMSVGISNMKNAGLLANKMSKELFSFMTLLILIVNKI